MKSCDGQILIPGLALFLGLMTLFLALVVYGRHVLLQMRINMYAEATALSAARAQAEMMNKYASYNLSINPMLIPEYHGYAAVQVENKDELEYLADYQKWWELPQFQIFPRKVGRRVAKMNGCDPDPKFIPTPSMLYQQDIEAFLMSGGWPTPPWPVEIDSFYYARTWGSGQRKAQPPHRTYWLVSKGGIKGTAGARLYLNVQSDDSLNNGGFPSVRSEHWWDDAQIQSFFPQFDARLLDHTPTGFKAILGAE
jgi:hypothetical protein